MYESFFICCCLGMESVFRTWNWFHHMNNRCYCWKKKLENIRSISAVTLTFKIDSNKIFSIPNGLHVVFGMFKNLNRFLALSWLENMTNFRLHWIHFAFYISCLDFVRSPSFYFIAIRWEQLFLWRRIEYAKMKSKAKRN